MEELTVLAQIEYTKENALIPTAFEPGIWRYCFYATGSILPFMQDTFNRVPVKVNNIIIDSVEYAEYDSVEELRDLPEDRNGWVNCGSVVYIRNVGYKPPFVVCLMKYGLILGFTNGSPVLIDDIMYRPSLLSAPIVSQSADAFTYDRMKFISDSIVLENTKGQFDDVQSMFGNEFNLLAGSIIDGELSDFTMLAQYYISNISVALDKATFYLKDKRERLSAKIPNRQYSEIDYPKIDDNLTGKDMQEVYGRCFGVSGVCLHGKQIYISGSSGPRLDQYRFRFSSRITRVDRIIVKMTAGEVADIDGQPGDTVRVDGWTTVYQRVKPNDGSPDDWPGNYPRWKPGINCGEGPEAYINGVLVPNNTDLLNRGEITLPYEVAKQGGVYENSINEVRMDGIFIDKKTPLEIITDIMDKYASIPFDERRYNINEITEELTPLNHEIGIMFDKSISVYEAIEKLQGGCALGFQFHVYENLFTARLDNPNRSSVNKIILPTDIKNLNEVEVDWNADLYGTYTDIEYRYDYGEGSGRYLIDKSLRQQILNLHRVEKEWSVHTLLAEIDDAQLRSNILLEDFSEMHPLIKNIKLLGRKWFELRVYDIYYIDFRILGEEKDKYPHNLIRLIEYVGDERFVSSWYKKNEYVTFINDEVKENIDKRDFVGSLRCQILRIESDTQTGITTIDVRVRKESEVWAAA